MNVSLIHALMNFDPQHQIMRRKANVLVSWLVVPRPIYGIEPDRKGLHV